MNFILQSRRLLQQSIIDSYANLLSERLQFLRSEQGRLRVDHCTDLRGIIVNQDGDSKNVGQKVIFLCYMFHATCSNGNTMP